MNRKEKKQKRKEAKKRKCKSIEEKANLFVEVGNKTMTCYKEKKELKRILNESNVKENNRNKIDIYPLEVEIGKLNKRTTGLKNLYLEAKKSLEMEYGKPLLH